MSPAMLFGSSPQVNWTKYSKENLAVTLEDVKARFRTKDIVTYTSGHIFLSVYDTDQEEWQRVALMEFPGTYATAVPGKIAEAMEENMKRKGMVACSR